MRGQSQLRHAHIILWGEQMNCTVCGRTLTYARLTALAKLGFTDGRRDRLCITCASKDDVPLIKRFDERRGEEEVQTYFVHNPYIEHAIKELLETPLPDSTMRIASGDDSQSESKALVTSGNAKPLAEDED